jgi:serine/threonine-protein kinase
VTVRNLGKYRIIAELGHGGMADVFLAMVAGPLGSGFSKLAVVKRLRPNLVEDPDFIAMLVDEARISARLNHSNVVQTLEVDVDNGEYFIAMEFLDGQPLHRLQRRALRNGKPLSALHQYIIVADALAGLEHAHELCDYDGSPMGIVHRDVTPQNIFVTYDGQVKVVDFGIAKAAGRASETQQGIVKGKVRYMSPEQATGQYVDRRSDVFAAGVLLWEAATGQRFWEGTDEVAIIHALLGGEYDASPRSVDASVPPAIDAMCRKAMAFHPSDRYATAADLRADLESFLADSVVLARRSLGPLVSELFAKERRKLREVIEASSKANVEPMSLVTFTSASGSQALSVSSFPPPRMILSTPPPALVPSLAPVMLSAEPSSFPPDQVRSEGEGDGDQEEKSSRVGGVLAALALAASIVLAFSGPHLASVAQGGTSSVETREAAEVSSVRTARADKDVVRGKWLAHARGAITLSSAATTPAAARGAHDLREAPPPAAQENASSAPPATPPPGATIIREGARRKTVLDTADPWSAAH